MGDFSNDRTVVMIKGRLLRLGLNLDQYVDVGGITNTWSSTPAGFAFNCKDEVAYRALMFALVRNAHFGADNMLASSKHRGASFREVNPFDSLHVVLSKRPDRTGNGACSIHLDSVSIAAGRHPHTGHVIYDQGKVFQHLATDLLHTPLGVPGGHSGIVFEIRF